MKKLSIKISGSGTREDIISALNNWASSISYLTDEEIENGGDIEDGTLAGEYGEITDSGDDDDPDSKDSTAAAQGKVVPFESPAL
ncbi:MAG: hypothetical protein ABJH04_08055 [Cyclobacteriaceae bacterium]